MRLFDFFIRKECRYEKFYSHQYAVNTQTSKMSQTVTAPQSQPSSVCNHTTSHKHNDIVVLSQQFNFAHNTGSNYFGDRDINSVAAENAFYCLSRNLIEKGNSFVAPTIFYTYAKR